MSGIAGILQFDRRPIDPSHVGFLADALAHRGPDGIGRWHGEGIALVQALLVATPEGGDPEPVADHSGAVRLTFDGRLDNRAELLGALDGRVKVETDAEVLLQAYLRWGQGCVGHLLGDFAFALWDGRRRRLFCGRDPLGLKPFAYRVDGRRLVWASEIAPLARLPGVATRPNLGMVAEFLANNITSKDETVWEGVHRLPPAHTLTVEDDGRMRLDRYWDLDPTRKIRHSSHEEYAEHLREVLTAAVRDRMRTAGPAVAELSGGIDSSAIVGIGSAVGGAPGIKAVSLVYPGRDCDESVHIDAVARHCGLDPVKLTPIPAGTFDYEEQARRTADVPAYPAIALWTRVYAAARRLGATSLLSGIGGDEWFRGTEAYAADLLRAGRLRDLHALARHAAREDSCSTATILWHHGARALLAQTLPNPLSDLLRAQLARRRAPWIRPSFARSVGLRDRLRVPTRRDLVSISQGQICRTFEGGILTHSYEFVERFTSQAGLELRLPFLDRRVLEFALAIPEAERWGTKHPKRVLRAAVRGLAPDTVVDRLDKAGPSYISAEQLLSPATAHLLGRPAIEREGWVDGERLRAMYAEMADGYRRMAPLWETHIWPLWRSVAVELWLRANDGA